MATLQSPGVSVTVIDESIYTPAGGGTIPLIITASRQNKLNPSGNIAAGTLPQAADSVLLTTSRSNLVELFGNPTFNVLNGTPIHGDETNEYGLHAAWQALGQINQAYVLNANIDLDQLEGSASEPTRPVESGTHWFDLSKSNFGLFKWNATSSAWEEAEILILNDEPGTGNVQPMTQNAAQPRDTFGVNGDFAVVTSMSPMIIYEKVGGTWVMLGAQAHPNNFQMAPHTRIPNTRSDGTPLQDGDTFVKTTLPNGGTYFDVSVYDGDVGNFVTKEVPLYMANDDATSYFKNAGEYSVGAVYAQIDHEGALNPDYNYDPARPKYSDGVAVFTLKRLANEGATEAVSNQDVVDIDLSTYPTSEVIINGVTVTFDASTSSNGTTVTVEDMVNHLQSLNALQAQNIRTELSGTSRIKFIQTEGKDITVQNVGVANTDWTPNTMTDVARVMGFGYSVSGGFQLYRKSNWEALDFVSAYQEPTREAEVGRLWYSTDMRVELLEAVYNNTSNQMEWQPHSWSEDDGSNGLSHKLYLRSAEPESPSDGDIWVDSDDIENYPTIRRYNASTSSWVLLDNSDQTTANGVVFGNYAYEAPFDEDGNARTNAALIDEEFIPNPELYPEGILLFNMDYSTYNVKEYQGSGYWASVAGNRPDGSPYMGRKAQRQMVVRAMKRAVSNSQEARANDKFFNLIIAPGYPELLPELNALNTARKKTAFVVGSSPMRLEATGQAVQDWANNNNGALVDGEDGLVTFNNMSAVWAFAGIQSDANGNTVAVPSDVLALQTILQNDRVAYPWFAPAGSTRGLVPSTTAVGYVEDGEFRIAQYDDGLTDALYVNKVNPIINFPNEGIQIFGQKTLATVASSMDRINVARLVAYLRYMLERITRPFLFEPNDSQTRQAALNVVQTFLADILEKRGITDFLVVCDTSNNTPARIDRNELWIDVAIVPTKAVEFIYIPVRLKNTGEI